jgi:hypothetical protein
MHMHRVDAMHDAHTNLHLPRVAGSFTCECMTACVGYYTVTALPLSTLHGTRVPLYRRIIPLSRAALAIFVDIDDIQIHCQPAGDSNQYHTRDDSCGHRTQPWESMHDH